MTYARVCENIDLSKPLPNEVTLRLGSLVYEKNINYENIPFGAIFVKSMIISSRCVMRSRRDPPEGTFSPKGIQNAIKRPDHKMNNNKIKLVLQGQNILMQKSKCPDTKKFTNRNGSSVLGHIMHPVEPCIIQ